MWSSTKRSLSRSETRPGLAAHATAFEREIFSPSGLGEVLDDTLPLQRAYRWEKERAAEVFLTQPLAGQARDWTFAQAMAEVRRMAAYLIAQNWEPESRIVILSKNCAWWMMAELAIWMSGHVSVPIYPSLSAHTVNTLLEHCEPKACFVGAVDDRRLITEAIPSDVMTILFPSAHESDGLTWDGIVKSTAPLTANPIRTQNEIATIIYTSGTTGTPKGVMHRFAAFSYFVSAVIRVFGGDRHERMLSYLPLAHIAERALVEASAFYRGYHIFFVENVSTFRADLLRARPTVFFSVPRLFLKFQQGVLAKIPQAKLDRLLRTPVANIFVRRRILRELGLDTVRIAASGGAALPVSTLRWFRSIGLNLVEGYGMTETGITHTPPEGRSRPGYVGNSVPGVETKLSEDGEVLIRSHMNMVGYFKNPDATKEAFTEDGFFRTGDLGEIDAEGWLKIIGRAKEQFKTSKGKYVSPATIEKLLGVSPLVEACCVMGSGMPNAFALILPSEEVRNSMQDADGRAKWEPAFESLLDSVNGELDVHEQLDFLVITAEPWTIANGFLTPTMKLRRNMLEATYSRHFEDWLMKGTAVVWHDAR